MTRFQIEMKKLSETESVANFHNAKTLEFTAIENRVIRNLSNKLSIHTSVGYSFLGHRSNGSEYFLAEINGKIAYVRISNHWGQFDTRDRVTGDWNIHAWNLSGVNVRRADGQYKAVKMAGFVYI